MKKIFIFLSIIALGVSAASCSDLNNTPVFDDANAFVEFSKTSFSVAEDGGSVTIPVVLSSLSGKEENVSYELVSGTAKQGVDFDVEGATVLKFSASARIQNIVVKIINRPGVYTGDTKFSVVIKSAGGCQLGMNTTCSVSITDNDHPLANILGSYTATSLNYGGASQTWQLNFIKDADDVTVVHIDAIAPGCVDYSSWGDWSYTGSAEKDPETGLYTLTLGPGQTCQAWYASETDVFKLLTWTPGIYLDDTTPIVFKQVSATQWECAVNIWLYPVETKKLYTNWCVKAPFTLTKN